MARYTSKQTTVTFEDNVGTSITVGPGQGDFNVGPVAEDNTEVSEVKNRGVHDGLIEMDDLVQDWSVTIELENQSITDAAAARILDWIRKANFYSGLQSVDPTCWAWKVIVTMNDGTTTSTIELPKARCPFNIAEAKEGHKITLSGKNYLAPTFA